MADDRDKLILTLLRLVSEAKAENLGLQAVCAALLGEVALLNRSPHAKLDHMVTALRGAASGLASGVNTDHTISITAVIERVCSMAEGSLQDRSPRG